MKTMFNIKSTSSAAWWIKYPKTYKQRATLCQDMTDLFHNISMHGYNKLLETNLYEKLFWFCLHAINFVIVVTVLSYTWEQFVSQYISLQLHDPLYPIENVPFPGVSICSNNRISRKAAAEYAYELSLKDPHNRSAEYFFKFMPYFISLYYKFTKSDSYDDSDEFQYFLDTYGTNKNETFYDVRKILEKLTPSCRDLILKCILNAKEIDCFGQNAFKDSFTMYGPCCTFTTNEKKSNSSHRLNTPDLGLTVFLNSSHSDDLVSLLNVDAYVVFIHNQKNFPDSSSGEVVEIYAMDDEQSFIVLSSKLVDTNDRLKSFSSSYRKCFYEHEKPDRFYTLPQSFTNCVMNCRIESIFALCGCVPFLVPTESVAKLQVRYCTLSDVACMQNYNFKLRNVLTYRAHVLGLERELEEALYCPHCLPSCDDTQYQTSIMTLPRDHLVAANMGDDFNSNLEDTSVLTVYFGSSSSIYYKRVIAKNWEEAFSTVGNVVSIFLGFSMVAVFEILVYALKYLYVALKMFIIQNKNYSKQRMEMKTKPKKLHILP